MNVVMDLIKIVLIPLVLLVIPILFILIFDIGAHLRELFGRR